jgi:hypothetical protein
MNQSSDGFFFGIFVLERARAFLLRRITICVHKLYNQRSSRGEKAPDLC